MRRVVIQTNENRYQAHGDGSRPLRFVRLCWQPCLDPSRNVRPSLYLYVCSGSASVAVPSAAGFGTNPHAPVTPTLHADTDSSVPERRSLYCERRKLRSAPASPTSSPASSTYCRIMSARLGDSVAVAMS